MSRGQVNNSNEKEACPMGTNRVDKILNDARLNLRVRDGREVLWQVQGVDFKGKGKVLNVSSSGLLLETTSNFLLHEQCVFSFDSSLGQENYIPSTGQLVWCRTKGLASRKYLCGIKFIDPGDFVLSNLRRKIQKGVLDGTKLRKFEHSTSLLLSFLILGLTGYVLWLGSLIYKVKETSHQKLVTVSEKQTLLTRRYAGLYQEAEQKRLALQSELNEARDELEVTRKLYQDNKAMLGQVSQDLNEAKAILVKTEALLVQAAEGTLNIQEAENLLKDLNAVQIAETKSNIEKAITALQGKNDQVGQELKTLRDKLKYYDGDIKDFKEGKELLALYRKNMKSVKSRMKHFRKQAQEVRRTAQKEMERIRTSLGNHGYFVQNGMIVKIDQEKYDAARIDSYGTDPRTPPTPDKIKIDVTFVE